MITPLTRALATLAASKSSHSQPMLQDSPATQSERARPRSILVPLDGSETSFEALRTAVDSAEPGASVYALQVVRELRSDMDYIRQALAPERREDRATSTVERALRERGITGAEVIARAGSRREAIAAAAAELGCDLIVVPSKRRSRLARFLAGPPAEAVARQAACPVLVV